jgi:hypothetical protein
MLKQTKISVVTIALSFFALTLAGCTDIGVKNIEPYNETDLFPYPLSNCGNSEALTVLQKHTYDRGYETYVDSASGISMTSSDIADLKSEIEQRRGSAKNMNQTSSISLSLTAEANSQVIYTLERIYGWEKGELYETDTNKTVATYKTRTGFFSVAIKSREEKPCP